MTEIRWWYDLLTAALWFALAGVGMVMRIRRLRQLYRLTLVQPVDQRDADYLASVKRSTYYRLCVKCAFLVGATIALFSIDGLWWLWRLLVVLSLAAMLAERR